VAKNIIAATNPSPKYRPALDMLNATNTNTNQEKVRAGATAGAATHNEVEARKQAVPQKLDLLLINFLIKPTPPKIGQKLVRPLGCSLVPQRLTKSGCLRLRGLRAETFQHL
jgi:hypothetical protein